jgi:hypothetical protein
MNKVWLVVVGVVVLVGVGVGGYGFLQYRADAQIREQLNHCLDVADKDRKASIESLNYLESFGQSGSPVGISADQAATGRQKAEDDHKVAVAECQIRYPVK